MGWAALGAAGFLLSPLSWWNDLWVNVPIAYLAGAAAERLRSGLFMAVFVAAYWLTNVAGLALLQIGAVAAASGTRPRLDCRSLVKWAIAPALYTAAAVLLWRAGVLKPFTLPTR